MTQRTNNTDRLPWWKGAVIYQIYPRSFRDTTGNGVGDLRGILHGLDHIADLGVDGVWISPFFTSPMADFGYDVADFCDVDPIFGSLADFDAVVQRAHALGLKVIIDQVYSHTSDQHEWFVESRSGRENARADWYVWTDPKPDGAPPNNWQSVFGGSSWEWDARRGQYYLHNFLKEQPDLNLYNSEVREAVIAAGRFWLDRGVDGFRLDALNFAMHDRSLRDNPSSGVSAADATRPFDMQLQSFNMSQPQIVDFIEDFARMLKDYPGSFTVAEVAGAKALEEMKAFTHGDWRLNSAYNFDYLYAPDLTAQRVVRSGTQWDQSDQEGWPSWAFSNHDAPRAVTRWAPAEQREEMAKLYLMLLLSLRGNPILYQGEELGLPQGNVPFERLQDPEAIANWPKTLGRDGARTPIPWDSQKPFAGFSQVEPWLPMDPAHAQLAIDTQQSPESMLAFTQRALSVRSGTPALKVGNMRFIETSSDEVLIIERSVGEDRVWAVFNLGDASIDMPPSITATGDLLLGSRHITDIQQLPARTAVWIQSAAS